MLMPLEVSRRRQLEGSNGRLAQSMHPGPPAWPPGVDHSTLKTAPPQPRAPAPRPWDAWHLAASQGRIVALIVRRG